MIFKIAVSVVMSKIQNRAVERMNRRQQRDEVLRIWAIKGMKGMEQ